MTAKTCCPSEPAKIDQGKAQGCASPLHSQLIPPSQLYTLLL